MIPRQLPPGTTLSSLITELIPEDHRSHVPKGAGNASVCVSFIGGATYVLHAEGDRLHVKETRGVEDADVSLRLEERTAQLLLDDWLGPQKLAPSFEPRGLASITDARFLSRVSSVKGVISLTLDDFEGQEATVLVASGKKASVYDDPDAEIHITLPAFLELLAGRLRPDEAIADGHVSLRGKKLVAMQLALTLVPYFPVRG